MMSSFFIQERLMHGTTLRYAVSSQMRWLLIAGMIAGFALSALPVGIGRASGVIHVTSTLDRLSTDGLCTLREAIIAANKDIASSSSPGECEAGSGDDTIIVPAGTYTLTRSDNGKEDSSSTGDLDITGNVVISPTGTVTITAPSGFTDRIFHVLSGNVTISGVIISGGK